MDGIPDFWCVTPYGLLPTYEIISQKTVSLVLTGVVSNTMYVRLLGRSEYTEHE
jgi:hypothetical protein